MASDNKYFKDSSPPMVAILDGRVYDATEQQYILHKVQSAFFLTVVCSQACHIFQVVLSFYEQLRYMYIYDML